MSLLKNYHSRGGTSYRFLELILTFLENREDEKRLGANIENPPYSSHKIRYAVGGRFDIAFILKYKVIIGIEKLIDLLENN